VSRVLVVAGNIRKSVSQRAADHNGLGPMLQFFKIFSPKIPAKIFAFFAQTSVSFCKNCDHVSLTKRPSLHRSGFAP
jgi:hypothetical protein